MKVIMNKNKTILEQIKKFEEQTGIKLQVKNSKPYYSGVLYNIVSDYLPDNLVVDGDLYCNCLSKKLPNGLEVNGSLTIAYTKITEIPNDCSFNSLDMSATSITKLQNNLKLHELCIYGSDLEDLPRGLTVELLNISKTNITKIPYDCKFNYLNMSYTKITNLKDNLTLCCLNAKDSSLSELPRGLKVEEQLNISNTKITEIPDDCEFNDLIMVNSKITKLRDNLTLKRLDSHGSSLSELPRGLKVKRSLNISDTKITEIPDDCEFGYLDMENTKITKLRDNLTLDDLCVDYSSISELPNNLVVYGSLFMDKTPFNTIPEDCLALIVFCNSEFNDERYEIYCGHDYHLKDEIVHIFHPSGREFLHVDGILSEVIEKKGNVYHVKNGVNEPISYVVTDGNNHWAHGYTLDSAKQDLRYKMSVRDKSEYEKLTLESELTFDEAVACYRVITGACKFGTNDYLKHRLPEPRKEKYTIKEIIELTKGEYGGKEFREFFENDNL